jgi:hypothetical protein
MVIPLAAAAAKTSTTQSSRGEHYERNLGNGHTLQVKILLPIHDYKGKNLSRHSRCLSYTVSEEGTTLHLSRRRSIILLKIRKEKCVTTSWRWTP